jgi:alpha/beta superfamily hydrolase
MSAPPSEAPTGAGSVPDGRLFFPGDDRLEGILEWPQGVGFGSGFAAAADPSGRFAGGVVVAHPHPLGGGTMAQPVVYRTAQACREKGLATLRFNFRGVGESLGTFSGTEEHLDVQAAAAFLRGRMAALEGDAVPGPSTPPLGLAGYSFGSIMAARAAAEAGPVAALALIGFVTSWPELPSDTFDRLRAYRGPVLAVCAENDDLGYPEEVERVLKALGIDFTMSVVERAGHLLEGRQREVGEIVAGFLAKEMSLGHPAATA